MRSMVAPPPTSASASPAGSRSRAPRSSLPRSGRVARMGTTETETAREIVTEYFAAIREQDMDRAVKQWRPGSIDHLSGFGDLIAPDGIRDWFNDLFAAVPDFRLEVRGMVAEGN